MTEEATLLPHAVAAVCMAASPQALEFWRAKPMEALLIMLTAFRPCRPQRSRHGLFVAILLPSLGMLAPVAHVAGQELTRETVLATVGEEPITLGDVYATLQAQAPGRELPPNSLALLGTKMLDAIVRQKLLTLYLQQSGIEVSDAEVAQSIEAFKAQVTEAGFDYEKYLTERGLTEATLRERMTLDVKNKKYLEKELTDDVVHAYFDEHHTEFDGSQKRLGHIMIRPSGGAHNGQQAAIDRAKRIRQQISEGTLTFGDAAQKYSDAPSRRDEGDLGYMKRDAPWDPKFMETAFALDEDQLSDVITTEHGVHLILCTKIRRGYQTFEHVRDQVYKAAVEEMRKKAVNEQRSRTPVTFTGAVAHIDLDTGETIPAGTPAPPAAGEPPSAMP